MNKDILQMIERINSFLTIPKFTLQNQQTKDDWTDEQKQGFKDILQRVIAEIERA